MTISLAIDTATSRTIVAIVDDGKVLFESFHEGAMDHGKAISELVSQALKVCPVPNQVVVGMGPGPFTGLRVGIAAAKMFAEGVSAPIYGVGSLDAIAFANSLDEPTLVLTDARRSEVFFGLYQGKTAAGVPKALLGPGVKKQAELEAQLQVEGHSYLLANTQVSAANLGLLGLAQLAEGTANTSVVANYLRAPDAVPAKGKKVSG